MHQVNGRRKYNSAARQAAAQRNRDTILDAAEMKFLRQGYFPTTVAEIASDAGVSPETIYKAFGGKPGIVHAIYTRGLAGTGQVAAYERSDEMRLNETNPVSLMQKWGALTAEVASALTPILLLVRSSAATDENMAALQAESDTQRLERMRHNALFLQSRGFLRHDVSVDEAVDVMWTCSSPELYDLLVLQRGWSLNRFGRFVASTMISALLPADDGT
ncbi:helix-turn-helix domain-containing protein [Mycetocola sp. 2940]|uniref:TetR/AcrR family transcriptional regulator n=1 Tax=Mycetocola sp. 2940 TaxID=3156452 RepID=UPI00339A2E5C